MRDANARPLYEQIKTYIADKVDSGAWACDERIPSENEFARQFSASRMTVNRAIRELTAEGRLRRKQGAGTYINDPRPNLDLLHIRNIADEIRDRGHLYGCAVRHVGEQSATRAIADALDLRKGSRVFHSVLIHSEDGVPMQIEERYVNPTVAPDYLSVDFGTTTPNEHLMAQGPLGGVEHTLEAILPDKLTQSLLQIGAREPCLLLHRRTWTRDLVASRAWLTHPGSRYRFAASVMTNGGGAHRPPKSKRGKT